MSLSQSTTSITLPFPGSVPAFSTVVNQATCLNMKSCCQPLIHRWDDFALQEPFCEVPATSQRLSAALKQTTTKRSTGGFTVC